MLQYNNVRSSGQLRIKYLLKLKNANNIVHKLSLSVNNIHVDMYIEKTQPFHIVQKLSIVNEIEIFSYLTYGS